MDSPDWEVPHGALDVAIPRTPSRILLQTAIVHCCTALLLTYLVTLLPRTRHRGWKETSIQLLVLLQIPTFFLTWLGAVALSTLVMELGLTIPNWLAQYTEATRLWSFIKSRHSTDISRTSSLYLSLICIPLVYGCFVELASYAERFGVSYHASSDVGMLGIDHRNGWVGATGLLAGSLALIYRSTLWFLQMQEERAIDTKLVAGLQVILEEDEEKDDNSSELLSEDRFSDHDTFLGFGMNAVRKTMLIEALFAVIIYQIPLAATHRGTFFITFLSPLPLLAVALGIVVCRSADPSSTARSQRILFSLAVAIISWTVMQSTFHDLIELKCVDAGLVYPWSIRWKATDRFDRILRAFV